MALLADAINDEKGPQPVLEKKRCLRAIREMVKVAKGHIGNGIPQVDLQKAYRGLTNLYVGLCLFAVGDTEFTTYQRCLRSLDSHA